MDSRQSRRNFNLHNLPPIISPPFQSRQLPGRGGLYQGYPGPQLRYPANPGLYFPPPPPLLKLGHQVDIQRVSSGASISLSQQTSSHDHSPLSSPPIQSSSPPCPLSSPLIRASFSPFNQQQIRPPYSPPSLTSPPLRAPYSHSPLTTHLIGLLQKPPSSSPVYPPSSGRPSSSVTSPPSPGPLPLTIKDALSPSSSGSGSSLGERDHPVVSEESDCSNTEPSNAAKCKEYRERNKQKRRREEEEYFAEYEKHKKLKAKYERQKKSIKRLKEYYLELLKKGDLMTCPKLKKTNPDNEEESPEEDPPLVTVKTEIELNVNDIIVKTENQL